MMWKFSPMIFSVFFLVLAVPVSVALTKNDSKNIADRCFCKLKGEVDDCSCTIETIDSLNNLKIQPIIYHLVKHDYFRYFKVNLKKKCPFWADDSRCALKDCHVDKCKEDDVPEGLKRMAMKHSKYTKESQEKHSCEEERELSALNTTISAESKEAFKDWTKFDDAQETFCEIDDEHSSDMEYVDLLLNPERYTGYKGMSPHRIWRSIYEENCFKFPFYLNQAPTDECVWKSEDDPRFVAERLSAAGIHHLPSNPTEGLCLEKRVFYRMISGLHTSINIHLCSLYWLTDKHIYGMGKWGSNLEEFKKRFDPETTNQKGPQWLRNLYFTYLVEMRAIAKAAPYLERESFYTGNKEQDAELKNGIQNLLQVIKAFPDQFDESKLFCGNQAEAKKLKEEFRNHFRNISLIMDCLGCDKCKLWGKLQTQGMGTALKILFSGDTIGPDSIVTANRKRKFQLRRTEIVSLINAFARLSNSIKELNNFRTMLS